MIREVNELLKSLFPSNTGKTERYRVTVSPATATILLTHMAQLLAEYGLVQRKAKSSKVHRMVEDMLKNRFHTEIAPIHLAPNGAIINGMHRLLAVKQSEQSVIMDVWTNVPPARFSQFDSYDTGRSLTDVLTIAGESNPRLKATLLPKIVLYLDGKLGAVTPMAVPVDSSLETLEDHRQDIEEAVAFAEDAEIRQVIVAFMYFAYSRAGHLAKVKAFLRGFKDGADLTRDSMSLRFRNYVVQRGRDLRERKALMVFFNVLNAVVELRDIHAFGNIKGKKYVITDGPKAAKKSKAATAGRR